MAKTRVIVVYGGKSSEHEISCRSAAFILKNLDPQKYDIQAYGVDRDGLWHLQNVPQLLAAGHEALTIAPQKSAKFLADRSSLLSTTESPTATVVFPIIHGTHGEDGSLQGFFDLTEVAYVGADTLGSAVGMDKVIAKRLVHEAGIPIVPYCEARPLIWKKSPEHFMNEAIQKLGLPIFVKPARLGSSVGVRKVKKAEDLRAAVENAFRYDDKVLLEKELDVREIECAILGGENPEASIPGEVAAKDEFYTYEAKYLDPNGADIIIPAKLTPAQVKEVQEMSCKIFKALDLYGMSRVDLFLDKASHKFFFNEVNTIPGFTSVSQYPMLWKASGVGNGELLDRLIALALERWDVRKNLSRQM